MKWKIRHQLILLTSLTVIMVVTLDPLHCPPRTATQRALSDARTLSTAIALYHLETGQLPVMLSCLFSKEVACAMPNYNGPYLKRERTLPWGSAWHYQSYTGSDGRPCSLLWNFGADHAKGGDKRNQDIAHRECYGKVS